MLILETTSSSGNKTYFGGFPEMGVIAGTVQGPFSFATIKEEGCADACIRGVQATI